MERQKVWGWSKDISEASVNSCAVHRVGTKPLPGRVWHNIYCQPHSLILYHTCSVSGNHHGNMLSLHRITGVGRELLRPWSPTPLQNPCKTCFLQQVIQVVVQVEPEYLQRKRLYSFPGEAVFQCSNSNPFYQKHYTVTTACGLQTTAFIQEPKPHHW